MKIDFFEYKENCKEFKILNKATSKEATRADLKKKDNNYLNQSMKTL